MRRAIAMIVVSVVKPVLGSKEKRRSHKEDSQRQQNYFDIHRIRSKVSYGNSGTIGPRQAT